MILPDLLQLNDWALLLLRLVVATIFISSGWSHATKPEERSKSIEMSKTFTLLLGIGEVAAGVGIGLGIYVQLCAALLMLIMLGAMAKKIFVWETGYFGKDSMGWHYDLLLFAANFVFLTTNGGSLILLG